MYSCNLEIILILYKIITKPIMGSYNNQTIYWDYITI